MCNIAPPGKKDEPPWFIGFIGDACVAGWCGNGMPGANGIEVA